MMKFTGRSGRHKYSTVQENKKLNRVKMKKSAQRDANTVHWLW